MHGFAQFLRTEFRPPDYLLRPAAGLDISVSAIKVARLAPRLRGLEVCEAGELPLPAGAITGGEITDRAAVVSVLRELAKRHAFRRAHIALPEARGYLFEADVPAGAKSEARTVVEQHLPEYVPLPPAEVEYDFAPLQKTEEGMRVVGVGYARRVVEELVSTVEEAGILVRSVESETFALPRALLSHEDTGTSLIVDIGKSTTKLLVVTHGLPRLVTTLEVGGEALTLAIKKYFGNPTEEEVRRIKIERGIMPDKGNEEYVAAMLSTMSVIRDEIMRRVGYWQSHVSTSGQEPIWKVFLVGGNASVRGLPEYLADSLKIPVTVGDVYANCAPLTSWKPKLDRNNALAYGTAIGLALRSYDF